MTIYISDPALGHHAVADLKFLEGGLHAKFLKPHAHLSIIFEIINHQPDRFVFKQIFSKVFGKLIAAIFLVL